MTELNVTLSAEERAKRLRLVDNEADALYRAERELAASRRRGVWRWMPIGTELHFRSKALPTFRLDVTRTEAHDLMLALAAALEEVPPATPTPSRLARLRDWLARHTWNRAHEVERAAALKELADEFRDRGGW